MTADPRLDAWLRATTTLLLQGRCAEVDNASQDEGDEGASPDDEQVRSHVCYFLSRLVSELAPETRRTLAPSLAALFPESLDDFSLEEDDVTRLQLAAWRLNPTPEARALVVKALRWADSDSGAKGMLHELLESAPNDLLALEALGRFDAKDALARLRKLPPSRDVRRLIAELGSQDSAEASAAELVRLFLDEPDPELVSQALELDPVGTQRTLASVGASTPAYREALAEARLELARDSEKPDAIVAAFQAGWKELSVDRLFDAVRDLSWGHVHAPDHDAAVLKVVRSADATTALDVLQYMRSPRRWELYAAIPDGAAEAYQRMGELAREKPLRAHAELDAFLRQWPSLPGEAALEISQRLWSAGDAAAAKRVLSAAPTSRAKTLALEVLAKGGRLDELDWDSLSSPPDED